MFLAVSDKAGSFAPAVSDRSEAVTGKARLGAQAVSDKEISPGKLSAVSEANCLEIPRETTLTYDCLLE